MMNVAALAGAPSVGYHCYEVVLAFASVRDSGMKDAGLSAEGLTNFTGKFLMKMMIFQSEMANFGFKMMNFVLKMQRKSWLAAGALRGTVSRK